MRRVSLLRLLPLLLATVVAPLSAQETIPRVVVDSAPTANAAQTGSPNAVIADSTVAGASMTGLRAGVHAQTTARPDRPLGASDHANLGQSRAMMIVGGAALIVGAVIGSTAGTLVMVGGAVIGLAGLYQYLQ